MTGLDAGFETSKYFLPIRRHKFKMAEKVQNIKINGYNSKTIKHNVMFNSLCEPHFNWAYIYVIASEIGQLINISFVHSK